MWLSQPVWSSRGAGEIALIAPQGGAASKFLHQPFRFRLKNVFINLALRFRLKSGKSNCKPPICPDSRRVHWPKAPKCIVTPDLGSPSLEKVVIINQRKSAVGA